MVKLLQNFVEPVVQQSGQTGPIALLHVPVAQHRNNSDFLPNQISQIHKTVQLPPIPVVSIFFKITFWKWFQNVTIFLAAWSNWSEWGECVDGNHSRSRTCENETNGGGAVGAECAGAATEECGC